MKLGQVLGGVSCREFPQTCRCHVPCNFLGVFRIFKQRGPQGFSKALQLHVRTVGDNLGRNSQVICAQEVHRSYFF